MADFLGQIAGEPVLHAIVHVAAFTGMRRGEVCGLSWSDVDLDGAVVTVRKQLGVVHGAPDGDVQFGEAPKTKHGFRQIRLDHRTVEVLRSVCARQAEHKLAVGPGWRDERDLVFTAVDGYRLDPESISKQFEHRVRRSGLPKLTFHGLRHSHAAHLIEAGESPLLIARRLGHGSASFSLDRYGHLMPEADSGAAQKVADLAAGGSA